MEQNEETILSFIPVWDCEYHVALYVSTIPESMNHANFPVPTVYIIGVVDKMADVAGYQLEQRLQHEQGG